MGVARRRGRRRKKLLDDLKDRRGYSHLKEEALHCIIWRLRFGGGFGPVVRQNTEWMNEILYNGQKFIYFSVIYIEMDLELTVINCDILMYSTIRRCIFYNFTRTVYESLQFGNENFSTFDSLETWDGTS